MRRTILFLLVALLAVGYSGVPAFAQSSGTGVLRGTVVDPSGAVIPSATVALTSGDGYSHTESSRADGSFLFEALAPGRYSLSITAKGFSSQTVRNVSVSSGRQVHEKVVLKLPVEKQQVTVKGHKQGLSLSTNPNDNASAIIIKGKALAALSDDPDELQDELDALAGPAAGPNGAQIYIDGFSGGQLPPKSEIREIIINQNPFSAEYDSLGYGRIQIITKPGTQKLHGMYMVNGNDSTFNSLNPFVTQEPPYYSTFMLGNASGAMGKNASWFMNVFRRDDQSNSIINADLLDSSGKTYNYTAAVANPQSMLDLSPRFDFALGANNTLTVRYSYNRMKQTNSGVSQLSLQSQAYNVLNQNNTLQISDTQAIGANTLNVTRFEYMRSSNNQEAQNSDPTITVQGAFVGGGNNSGISRNTQNYFEFQNYTTTVAGKHSMNYGARLRYTGESAYSTAGFNGSYTYPTLSAYADHTPSEYSVTSGNPSASASLFDAALFWEDDYRVSRNLTISYGLRVEGQNRIHDHLDWAPRFEFAWAPWAHGKGSPKTVIRGGYGWFYNRFAIGNVLTTIQQNGVNQKQYVVQNPDFYQDAPAPSDLSTSTTVSPTIYTLSPNLKAALNMQAAVGIEHAFGKIATASVTYIHSRGVHQFFSNNINAYLPGTYDATTGTGTRPNGINENIYQFQSEGIYKQNQLVFNYMVNAKKVTLFGFYMLNFAKGDTSGANYFPSNPYDPSEDYGRATFDVHNRFVLGGNYDGPLGISLSPFIVANSGQPFNITIGQDLNGDNQYNDRPAFATASSTDTMSTKYGDFNLDPAWNQARIPYDYGTGPGQLSVNMRISKSFGIGPRAKSVGASGGMGGPGGGGPPPGGPPGGGHGGPPGGGLGPGGMSGQHGPPHFSKQLPRRYSVTFTAMGRNIFNNVNLGQPVGVLDSPSFGKSNSLAGGFFNSASSNRSIDLQMRFSF